jgi:uncharacterized small protein (DUF1192 family)
LTALEAATLERDARTEVPSDAALASVSELVARQIRLEDEIASAEAQLKAKNEDLRRVAFDELPAAMAELGLKDVRTTAGARVEIKSFVQASITKARQEEAFAWLRDHGHGDLVKHEVKVALGAGEDEIAAEIVESIRARGLIADDKATVHAQTLKAFLREQIENGADVPLDLFGAYLGQEARIHRS